MVSKVVMNDQQTLLFSVHGEIVRQLLRIGPATHIDLAHDAWRVMANHPAILRFSTDDVQELKNMAFENAQRVIKEVCGK